MKAEWKGKKEKTRQRRKNKEDNSFLDFFLDVLFAIPELIILPFRLVFWLIRGLGRFISDIF